MGVSWALLAAEAVMAQSNYSGRVTLVTASGRHATESRCDSVGVQSMTVVPFSKGGGVDTQKTLPYLEWNDFLEHCHVIGNEFCSFSTEVSVVLTERITPDVPVTDPHLTELGSVNR